MLENSIYNSERYVQTKIKIIHLILRIQYLNNKHNESILHEIMKYRCYLDLIAIVRIISSKYV